jgi:hypothetical protein
MPLPTPAQRGEGLDEIPQLVSCSQLLLYTFQYWKRQAAIKLEKYGVGMCVLLRDVIPLYVKAVPILPTDKRSLQLRWEGLDLEI